MLNSNLETVITELSTTANSKSVIGGYSVIGKTVIISGTVVVNAINSGADIIMGFPSARYQLAPIRLLKTDGTFYDAYISSDGKLIYRSATNIADSTTFTFCGAYITN